LPEADTCDAPDSCFALFRNPLQKVFAIDVLACPECSGRMQVIAFIAQAAVAKRILDHLGLDSTGPPVARAAPPPEQVDLGPSYDAHHATDPAYPE